MDTNQNVANNYQINTFTKGMNSDTSYDMIGADQYLFGLNIRITNNTLLLGNLEARNTEGIVTPVAIGGSTTVYEEENNGDFEKILATCSLDNIGIVILRKSDNNDSYWSVIKIEGGVGSCIYEHKYESWETMPDSISAFLHKETELIVNLYIADGNRPIILIDINKDNTGRDIDTLISNRLLPMGRLQISKTSGRLYTQLVLYAYRLYEKHGTTTKLSPLTKKIQIIDPNRNKELGNAENTRTSVGLLLSLDIREFDYPYDYIQIYRISYIKRNEVPSIYLIYDDKIENGQITYIDKGNDELLKLSLDEFLAMSGEMIIPQSIEQNQGYLFAGNIKDTTIIQFTQEQKESMLTYYSNNPPTIVYADVPIYNVSEAQEDNPKWNVFRTNADPHTNTYITNSTIKKYFDQFCISCDNSNVLYNDIFGSSLLRSLRRGETYRYGIVYYDKYGARSEVFKIYDVEVPENSNMFWSDGDIVNAVIAGVKFNVYIPSQDIVGYQIVRCSKSDEYTKNILQVALSRPSRQGRYNLDSYRTPYYPNVYLSTLFIYINYGDNYNDSLHTTSSTDLWTSPYFDRAGTNVENLTLYQIFAPEINIARKDTLSLLSGNDIKLTPFAFRYDKRDLSQIALLFESSPSKSTMTGKILYMLSLSNTAHIVNIHSSNQGFCTINNLLASIAGEYTDPTNQSNPNLIQTAYVHLCIPTGYTYDSAEYNNASVQCDYLREITYQGVTYKLYVTNLKYATSHSNPLVVNLLEGSSGSHLIELSSLNTYSDLEHFSSIDLSTIHHIEDGVFISIKKLQQSLMSDKSSTSAVINLLGNKTLTSSESLSTDIKNVSDVKNPNWNDGFSNVLIDGSNVTAAIKLYKSYTSNVGDKTYVNWVANGMYDLAATTTEAGLLLGNNDDLRIFHVKGSTLNGKDMGWIGPGPVSLLIDTDMPNSNSVLLKQVVDTVGGVDYMRFGTIIANIEHYPLPYDDSYTPYYGFGNFFSVDADNPVIFDGDVYITPAEFVNMFKTYDFNDGVTSLISGQSVYYIPIESRINTFFDYGMNYRNTLSTNLMLEPGEITGIASQSRPLHQYNPIYSDNNSSIEAFYPYVEDSELNYSGRIHYSQLKTNGENIDNWLIFKPIDFIDTDSQYGPITHLLSSENTLYYWQENAFGKLSVNERSLVKDLNSNAILLGTGGVLLRYDYLSILYGMRLYDRAAVAAEHGIYWIDINSRAIPAYKQDVVNLSEFANVQNLVNKGMTGSKIPTIDYDVLTNELLCKCLTSTGGYDDLLVFNLKLNCATSIYTRPYEKCLNINNKLYGLCGNLLDVVIESTPFNYLTSSDLISGLYLSPVKLQFSVNPLASLTKVYDNLKIVLVGQTLDETGNGNKVLLKNDLVGTSPYYRYIIDTQKLDSLLAHPFFTNKSWSFETDYCKTSASPEGYTDRENNIWYAIPRMPWSLTETRFGKRLRGKWMTTSITDLNPTDKFAISHIITKFRQSYN